jgi:hypothetical protein
VEDLAVDGACNVIAIDRHSVKVFSATGELLQGRLGGVRLGEGSGKAEEDEEEEEVEAGAEEEEEEQQDRSAGSCLGFCAATGRVAVCCADRVIILQQAKGVKSAAHSFAVF